MSADLDRAIRALAGPLAEAQSLVVLTGAGMSAESGVPTFRGPGGLWEGNRPEDLATPEAFARDPGTVWRWYRWRREVALVAAPHEGYRALAALERAARFRSFAVVTQNVDGLHQRSGIARVIELHGTIHRARCSRGCGSEVDADDAVGDDPPCRCGRGTYRPAVVWFGETLPEDAWSEAWSLLEHADMAWVVGTSALVYPAALLPRLAAEHGTVVVEVNPVETPLTREVAHSLRASAGRGLRLLAEARFRAIGMEPPPIGVGEGETRESL